MSTPSILDLVDGLIAAAAEPDFDVDTSARGEISDRLSKVRAEIAALRVLLDEYGVTGKSAHYVNAHRRFNAIVALIGPVSAVTPSGAEAEVTVTEHTRAIAATGGHVLDVLPGVYPIDHVGTHAGLVCVDIGNADEPNPVFLAEDDRAVTIGQHATP